MQSFVRGRDKLAPYVDTAGMRRRDLLTLAAFGLVAGAPGSAVAATPDGQLTWGCMSRSRRCGSTRRTSQGS
jgi:hypothetical protein